MTGRDDEPDWREGAGSFGEEEPPPPTDADYAAWHAATNFAEPDDADWFQATFGNIPSRWDREPTGNSEDDVDVDEVAKQKEKQILRSHRLNNDETEQRINQQKNFFKFALGIIGLPVVVASLAFGWMVIVGTATETVAAAFFASVVAEVIGLSLILGNYFFPKRQNDDNNKSAD